MPNGKYEPQCGNCIHFSSDSAGRRNCKLHNFVMPAFSDYVVCANWRSIWNEKGINLFYEILINGFLYRWAEYRFELPRQIGPFEEIQELLLDLSVPLVENPEYGWSIYISAWDQRIFPQLGETVAITLDDISEQFYVADIEITVTYTHREADGKLHMEDRAEIQRAIIPVANAKNLVEWIERHHDLAEARRNHESNLENPKFLNKNKPLRLFEYLIGKPDRRVYSLRAGIGMPRLNI